MYSFVIIDWRYLINYITRYVLMFIIIWYHELLSKYFAIHQLNNKENGNFINIY